MKTYELIKNNKKILFIFLCVAILFLLIYSFFFKCQNPYIEKNGLVYKNCSLAYFKTIGIKDSSMFMSFESKEKYKDIGVAPKSLLIWFPENEKEGILKVFHTQFGYRNLPLANDSIKDLIPSDKIKDYISTPLELRYRIIDKEIELSKDSKKWFPLWIRLIKSDLIKLDDADIPLPYNKIDMITHWFEGEYEYIWDSRITIEKQINSIDNQLFLRSK